jgi:dienelactone hydrolase
MKNLFILSSLLFSSLSFAQCTGAERIFKGIDQVDQTPWDISTKEYVPAKKSSVVFIVPPIVGETVLDRRLAEKFCANGMAAYIVQVVKNIAPEREAIDLSIHDESYVRAQGGVSGIIDILESENKFTGRYGILGMSLGGMLSAYIAGSEPRIIASVIAAGAGNAAGVLATSDQELVVKQRETRLRNLGFPNVQAYEEALRAVIPHDPLSVAGNIQPNSMYLFIANSDTTVPTKYQLQLRDAVREPLVFRINSAHRNALIKVGTIHAGKITSFLLRRL